MVEPTVYSQKRLYRQVTIWFVRCVDGSCVVYRVQKCKNWQKFFQLIILDYDTVGCLQGGNRISHHFGITRLFEGFACYFWTINHVLYFVCWTNFITAQSWPATQVRAHMTLCIKGTWFNAFQKTCQTTFKDIRKYIHRTVLVIRDTRI